MSAKALVVEKLREGWLVKNTTSRTEAMQAIRDIEGDYPNVVKSYMGRYVKVPGQWSDFTLYPVEDNKPGSFDAVIFHIVGARS